MIRDRPVAGTPSRLRGVLAAGLLASFAAADAGAQWSSDPAVNLALADRAGEQVVPILAAAPDGGTYVAWYDGSSGNLDVYLQRLDPAGVEQWPHHGILVSDKPQNSAIFGLAGLIADSAGNAVLVFTDERDGGDLDVHAYKVDPAGLMLWGTDGVTVSANPDFEPGAQVVEASDGDLVIAWQRAPAAGSGDLMLQRLSPAGLPRLAAGGVPVVAAAGEQPGFLQLVAADNGSVILSWVRDITSFSSPRHVRAAKFRADATPAWAAPANVYDAFSVPIAHYPKIETDGSGGALVCWHRHDGTAYNSLVQHLDAGGAELFPHNGVEVSTTPGMYHLNPTLSRNAATGELFLFWDEENLGQSQWGLFAQKLSPAGARLWGNGGIALLPVDGVYKSYPRSVPYGDGAIAFVLDTAPGNDRLIALRVDAAGNLAWSPSPLPIATAASTKGRYPVTIDRRGVAKVVWEDDRNGSTDVFAQAVNPKGTIGAADTCLYRSDVTSLDPHVPPRSAVYQPRSIEDISLTGTAYRCPFADRDTEPSGNAVALQLYQVDVWTSGLRLVKEGASLRFRF